MRAYQDKQTGLWKLGLNGDYKFKTEQEALSDATAKLTTALKKVREYLNDKV